MEGGETCTTENRTCNEDGQWESNKSSNTGMVTEAGRGGKVSGMKRKTVSYWKKLIREAGWDWTEIDLHNIR